MSFYPSIRMRGKQEISICYKHIQYCSLPTSPRTINAHRAILMAGSAYFETMFHGDFKEKESDKVSLGDSMEFQVLEMLVKFLYTGVLKPNKSISLERLLRAADYLQMADALEELHGLVDEELTCSNALSLWDLRNIIKCEETLAKIRSFILVNMMAIVEDISFLTIDVETITWILESDELTVNSEQDVFRWIRIWINHKYDSRLKHLPSLLRCVRYDAKMTVSLPLD